MVKKRNNQSASAGEERVSPPGRRPNRGTEGEERTAGPDGKILPLLLLSEAGAVVDVTWMNTKGFNKSREQGVLWTVHDETGRLLPYAGNTPFLRLVSRGRWYQAVVSAEVAVDLAGAETDFAEPGSESAAGMAIGASPADGIPATRTGSSADAAAGGATESAGGTPSSAGAPRGAVDALQALRAVIERRKQELPEGSYTSYLFKAGVEKIRKKTGEEAIELLLARERGDIVTESADLIYHLLVLLAEVGVGLDEVLAELEKRSR